MAALQGDMAVGSKSAPTLGHNPNMLTTSVTNISFQNEAAASRLASSEPRSPMKSPHYMPSPNLSPSGSFNNMHRNRFLRIIIR